MAFNSAPPAARTAALLLAAALTASLAKDARALSLSIAVAANAMPPMEELRIAFHGRTGIALGLVSGSSGKFSSQIRAGAPFDLFLSADTGTLEGLHADGFAEAPRLYARGRLILWSARSGVDLSKGVAGLRDRSFRKIAIADPKTAPYGRAALEALENAGVLAEVRPKLVFGESIGQPDSFIATGAADAGLTAKSAAFAPRTAGLGRWVEVPAGLHAPIEQSLAVLRHGRENHPGETSRLAEFLLSAEARAVWTRFGYEAVESRRPTPINRRSMRRDPGAEGR